VTRIKCSDLIVAAGVIFSRFFSAPNLLKVRDMTHHQNQSSRDPQTFAETLSV
jgi:hypothetical protein